MEESTTAYIAGFFDARGSINIQTNRPSLDRMMRQKRISPLLRHKINTPQYVLSVTVVAAKQEPLMKFAEYSSEFGGKVRYRKNGYYWKLYGHPAAWFLNSIMDLLVVKREQAHKAILFQGTIGGHGKYRTDYETQCQQEAYRAFCEVFDADKVKL